MAFYKGADQPDHWLQDKIAPDQLVLDDGSVWKVIAAGPSKADRWVRFSRVVVFCDENNHGGLRYRLLNRSFGEEVEAVFSGSRGFDQRPRAF
jgi:hypothetical protein